MHRTSCVPKDAPDEDVFLCDCDPGEVRRDVQTKYPLALDAHVPEGAFSAGREALQRLVDAGGAACMRRRSTSATGPHSPIDSSFAARTLGDLGCDLGG
jgi:hypothetical protein